MDHNRYIEQYLELDDDQLSAQQRLSISSHVANCRECQVLLTVEHATRTMLKENVCVIPAPDALRRQIAASLAACMALIVFNLRTHSFDNPIFDGAIASYVASQRQFVPTLGTKSTDDLA